MKKIFYLLLIILLSLIVYLIVLENNSSNKFTTSKHIESSSFTGKEIFSSFDNAIANPNRNFYTSMELEGIIEKQPNIILDKDVYSNIGIVLSGKKVIESTGIRRKIIFYKNSVALFANNADILFKNIDFYMVDTLYFLNELENSKSKIHFTNCRFFIEKNSSMDIFIENLILEKSLIYGSSKNTGADAGLLIVRDSKELRLEENIFYDSMKFIKYGISLFNVKNVYMNKNVVVSYLEGLKAPIMIDKTDSLEISENILVDLNNGYREENISKSEEEEEFLEGSIGIILRDSNNLNIKDNYFYTDNTIFPADIQALDSEKINKEFNFFIESNLSINCDKLKELPSKYREVLNISDIWGLNSINCK